MFQPSSMDVQHLQPNPLHVSSEVSHIIVNLAYSQVSVDTTGLLDRRLNIFNRKNSGSILLTQNPLKILIAVLSCIQEMNCMFKLFLDEKVSIISH